MKTTLLTARRSSLVSRFAAFRLAALAASSLVHAEATPAPRAPHYPRVWVAKRAPAVFDPLDAPLSPEEIAALPSVPDFAPLASPALLAEVDAEIAAEGAPSSVSL